MNIWHSLILGIVEGLTEFLPISSTAHLIITSHWLGLPSSEFLKTFQISIQLGAILAVVMLYWQRIFNNRELIGKIAAAFLPTALIGLAFYKIVKNYLLDSLPLIAGALIIGGLLIIVLEKYFFKHQNAIAEKNIQPDNNSTTETPQTINISYRQSIAIGVLQTLAMIPGVSRSGATIIGGLGLGVKRRDIVEFSFMLAIPTMAAATGLDLYKSQLTLGPGEALIWIIGFITSFITAVLGIKFFLKFIESHNFIPFGWYRIILGLAILLWLYL